MKFLPENKKKTLISVILIIISLGGMLWINFGKKPRLSVPTRTDLSMSQQPVGSDIETMTQQPSQVGESNLLPYGAKINTKILKEERFQALKSAPKVTVSKEELGNADPFSQ